jgi:hypothetical protein
VARLTTAVSLLLILEALILAGCGATPSAAPASNADFQKLAALYSRMITAGAPPASEAEFRTAIKDRLKPVADALEVTDVDALFVSRRDGKPIVVVYGRRPAGMNSEVVAYEQVGVDGKRLVGFSLGTIEEADEQRFRELVPAAN